MTKWLLALSIFMVLAIWWITTDRLNESREWEEDTIYETVRNYEVLGVREIK